MCSYTALSSKSDLQFWDANSPSKSLDAGGQRFSVLSLRGESPLFKEQCREFKTG